MSNRFQPYTANNGGRALGAALSGAATGVVLTYTCPAGKQATVRFVSLFQDTLAPTVAVQATLGGTTVNVFSSNANFQLNMTIQLNANDTVTLNVTTAVATSTFDGLICADEYLAE